MCSRVLPVYLVLSIDLCEQIAKSLISARRNFDKGFILALAGDSVLSRLSAVRYDSNRLSWRKQTTPVQRLQIDPPGFFVFCSTFAYPCRTRSTLAIQCKLLVEHHHCIHVWLLCHYITSAYHSHWICMFGMISQGTPLSESLMPYFGIGVINLMPTGSVEEMWHSSLCAASWCFSWCQVWVSHIRFTARMAPVDKHNQPSSTLDCQNGKVHSRWCGL